MESAAKYLSVISLSASVAPELFNVEAEKELPSLCHWLLHGVPFACHCDGQLISIAADAHLVLWFSIRSVKDKIKLVVAISSINCCKVCSRLTNVSNEELP